MNYFRCGGSEKVTIDGVKVKDKLELISSTAPNVKMANLPYGFNRGCAVVYNGEIHILGGYQSGETPLTNHYKFGSNGWTKVSTLPYPTYAGCAVVYEGAIHILGGAVSGNYRSHYKWDGTTWTQLPNIPYDFYSGGATVYSGGIHIFGGGSNSYNHYKWYNGKWTAGVSCPISFENGAVEQTGGNVYLFSGSTRTSLISDNSWGSSVGIGFDCTGARAVTLSDGLHLLGGGSGSTLTQNYIILSSKQKPALPYPFINGSAVVLNRKIHLLGGSNYGGTSANPTNHYILDADVLVKVNQ